LPHSRIGQSEALGRFPGTQEPILDFHYSKLPHAGGYWLGKTGLTPPRQEMLSYTAGFPREERNHWHK
jgi:hypothetical protein